MKPNFALSLSFEGIALLHRAAGGWHRVGEADLSADDLTADLAALRARAEALDPAPLRTKLIIPPEQIKYITLDTGPLGTPARHDAARAALDGATPYEVDQLVFDICEDGAQTHIAAVAQDTLDEAEAFARLHGFAPVSFVSVPGDAGFLGEPFFGVTALSETLVEAGDMVEPDGIAVVVTGDAPDPAPVTSPEAPRQPEPEAQPVPAQPPETTAEKMPPPEPDPAPAPAPEPAPPAAAKPDPAPAPDPESSAGSGPDPESGPAPSAPAPHATGDGHETPPLTATPSFASRRAAPALGGAERGAQGPVKALDNPVTPPAVTPALRDEAANSLDRAAAPPEDPAPGFAGILRARRAPETDGAPPATKPDGLRTGFLSRRKPPPETVATPAAETAISTPSEAQRMTIFGAREPEGSEAVGGKPRFLGLILTAVLLIFLAGIAAWASVFLDEGVAGLRSRAAPEQTASAPPPEPGLVPPATSPAGEPAITEAPDAGPEPPGTEIAALGPAALTDEDAAMLEALQDPQPDPQPEPDTAPDRAEADARYAVTGIWPLAPEAPVAAPLVDMEDLYIASIDPVSPAQDAIALPARAALDTDTPLSPRASPAPAGTRFTRDAAGRIQPEPDGVLTPDGFTLFAGRPPLEPPYEARIVPEAEPPASSRLAAFRPQPRPGDLSDRTERANLGGLTRSELAELRPRLRPDTGKEAEEAAAEAPDAPVSQFATATSERPAARPDNFERIVAQAARAPRAETQTAAAAAIAPRTVAPQIPSSTSVAREATVRNVLNLNRVNLIGVYGTPSSRRALVRLGNGRYRKVAVGDRIDGGRVSAIGESELRYRKGSRNLVLRMPD